MWPVGLFFHRALVHSISQTLDKKGFTFIEAISPCPTGYGRPNKLGAGLDEMRYYKEMSEVKNGADLREAEIRLREKFIVGTFVDTEKTRFHAKLYGKSDCSRII